MHINQLSETYFSAAQLAPEDFAVLRASGFSAVICNRPDQENPFELQFDQMRQHAANEGIDLIYIPLTQTSMGVETAKYQRSIVENGDGPVVAYCASGTRSTVIWALTQVEVDSVDTVLEKCANAGYPLEGLRPTLDAIKSKL